MNLEAIIIAAWPFDNPAPAHPDDKCSCGTTGNGAKPPAHVWIWRNTEHTASNTAEFDEKRNLQAAIDYWHTNDPARHMRSNKHLKELFDRAGIDMQLRAAILAHRDGKDVEYRAAIGGWGGRKTEPGVFYPSFDSAVQWRPAPGPKPKRPHADLIEKRLNESHWSYRIKGCSHWTQVSAPSFVADVEYKQEAAFTEGRKKLIRDWLDGTEYDYNPALIGGKAWRTATADEVINAPESYLRKKPTTKKLRIRTAVMKSTLSGGLPFTMSAMTDEQEAHVASLKQFIRWMGPWQETEVEVGTP